MQNDDSAAISRMIEACQEQELAQERRSVTAAIRGHMNGQSPLSAEQLEHLDERILALVCFDG